MGKQRTPFELEWYSVLCLKLNLFVSRQIVTSVTKSAITGQEYYDMRI
jgi:hypothetical protein